VVNAKKHQIQVLDSLGTMLGRKELERTIIRLEREINFVSRRFNLEEVEYRKWPDVKVTTWRVKEIIRNKPQTDGCSCGLFLINYMEYWTGDALSDDVNQDDMTEFRPKLAAILLLSEANIRKGCPYLAIDVVGSPNDVVEIENPMTIDDTPAKTTQCGQSEEKATPTRLDDCMLSQGKPTQDMPMTRTRMNTYS